MTDSDTADDTNRQMIVTIDGPAGSGKSTVARQLATRLGVRFLDTGAMYRAIAVAALRAEIDESDEAAMRPIAEAAGMEFREDRLLLNGEDVTDQLRTPAVDSIASIVSRHPVVRNRLVELQREIGSAGSLVTEGRDQGSVVFRDAEFKFFLTASLEVRARRRHSELTSRGSTLSLETVRRQLQQRDERDLNREHAPLKPAEDAQEVDTSKLTISDVVNLLAARVQGNPAANPIP